jgi:hypothetical protein
LRQKRDCDINQSDSDFDSYSNRIKMYWFMKENIALSVSEFSAICHDRSGSIRNWQKLVRFPADRTNRFLFGHILFCRE